MLKNHFLIAVRSLIKNRFYSLLNITGLAIGITATTLIASFVLDELSFDNFHTQSDQIVKANLQFREGSGDLEDISSSPDILLSAFRNEFSEVVGGVRMFEPAMFKPPVLRIDDDSFEERGFWFADSSFFQVFSFELLEGNADKVLVNPNSLVLTESAASKYFPDDNVIGQLLEIDGREYQVTGLMADPPNNSHLQFTMLGSFSTHPGSRRSTWGSANYNTYLLLSEGSSLASLQDKIQPYLQRIELSEPKDGLYINVNLVPLKDIHLKSPVDSQSDIKYVYIFSAIAFGILLIAMVNYINLATAKSTSRAKEVGVRKSIGAIKGQLVVQFLIESILITTVSVILSLVLINLLLPVFNSLTSKTFVFDFFISGSTLGAILVFAIVTGILAGVYPSFVISSYKPSAVLKGDYKGTVSNQLLRKGLVILQFGISTILIVVTMVVGKQMDFIRSKNLGYTNENVLYLPVSKKTVELGPAFKNEMTKDKSLGLSSISFVGETPTSIQGGYSIWAEGMNENDTRSTTAMAIDEDFVETVKLNLIAGSDITPEDFIRFKETGERQFILNESAMRSIERNLDNVIGMRVNMNGREGVVKGVVEDFHFLSLHQKIGPLTMFLSSEGAYYYAMMKLNMPATPDQIDVIQSKWNNLTNSEPFIYNFLDAEFEEQYRSEARMGTMFTVFSIIAIVIACLGLVGLISYTTIQRSKEIGIRKVMGASISSVIYLITKDFAVLIVGAYILASPFAYVLMQTWLQGFEYRTSIGVSPMVLSFLIAVLIASGSILYQVIQAATSDPIKVLRDE